MKKLFISIFLFMSFRLCPAQYWSDYVLEKGFNSRDYFLMPHRIVSIQIKSIDVGLLGIRPDTLSEIGYQPAMLAAIPGTKLYVDLKGSEEEIILKSSFIYPVYSYDNAYFLPPYMPRFAERKLQPMLSVIYASDVSTSLLPGVKYGLSYELIHHRGTYYEYVPNWYYGAYDAFGAEMAASRDFPELPVEVKKDGSDEKRETSHFFDFFTAVQLTKFMSLGVKVGRTQTDISGEYARFNKYDENDYQYRYQSHYLTSKNNSATLKQTEISGGVIVHPSEQRTFGLFGGNITGSHEQNLSEADTSFYSWGQENPDDYYSSSRYSHFNEGHWLHDGETNFLGLHGKLPMQKGVSLKFRLEYVNSQRDLENGDAAADSSYNQYHFQDYETKNWYESIFHSRLVDRRIGDGDEKTVQKSGAFGFVVPVRAKSNLTVGVHYQNMREELLVYEDVQVERLRDQETETPWEKIEKVEKAEDKTLKMDKTTNYTRIALPVAMDLFVGKGLTLRLGAVKQFTDYTSSEVIDIWYREEKTIITTPGGIASEQKPQHIDRYRATPVMMSDSSTDFRLGASYQPSSIVRFDLMTGTDWTDLKYWQFGFVLNL